MQVWVPSVGESDRDFTRSNRGSNPRRPNALSRSALLASSPRGSDSQKQGTKRRFRSVSDGQRHKLPSAAAVADRSNRPVESLASDPMRADGARPDVATGDDAPQDRPPLAGASRTLQTGPLVVTVDDPTLGLPLRRRDTPQTSPKTVSRGARRVRKIEQATAARITLPAIFQGDQASRGRPCSRQRRQGVISRQKSRGIYRRGARPGALYGFLRSHFCYKQGCSISPAFSTERLHRLAAQPVG